MDILADVGYFRPIGFLAFLDLFELFELLRAFWSLLELFGAFSVLLDILWTLLDVFRTFSALSGHFRPFKISFDLYSASRLVSKAPREFREFASV